MPELPDVELYVTRLSERVLNQPIDSFCCFNPFVLRTVSPKPSELTGRVVTDVSRLGKRIVLTTEPEAHIVVHLMIAGRFEWHAQKLAKRPNGKVQIAALDFPTGTLVLREIATKKRASIAVYSSAGELRAINPGGIEPLTATLDNFRKALSEQNRTVKRALTDPKTISGIGNAYSDEILFWAQLSPVRQTQKLSDQEWLQLFNATQETLTRWRDQLARDIPNFPTPAQITAFRPDFAVHGRFGQPCPVCGAPVQRIAHEDNETNYCAACQNEGRLLADRSLSRLFKSDWPRTLDELARE